MPLENSSRGQSGPVVGVGALVIKDGAVLLIQRGRFPGIGLWAIPGGKQVFGESLQRTAEREILEETSVQIEAGEPIYCFEAIFDSEGREWQATENSESSRPSPGQPALSLPAPSQPVGLVPAHHYVVIDLAAKYISGEPTAGDDADEAGWFTADAAARLPLQPATRRFLVHVEFL